MSIKILVVTDSATDLSIIKNALSEYRIVYACNSSEALQKIDTNSDIGLVLIDLALSNMEGLHLLSTLRFDNQYKDLSTIILTDYYEVDKEIEGLKLGAIDYIRKPFHIDSLVIKIEMYIEMLRMQQLIANQLDEHHLMFDIIFQQAPIGIAIAYNREPSDIDSNILYGLNPMFEKILGRTKRELLELGWEKITYPDDVKEDIQNFKKLQSGEIKSYAMEKRFIKPDSSIVWVYMIVVALTLEKKDKYRHICLIQDITERKETEKALAESEQMKSVLLSHLQGLAYRCKNDGNWTMEYVSSGCFELTGYPQESLLYNRDLSFNDFIAPEYHELVRKKWEYVLANKLPFECEYEILTVNGERKWGLELAQGVYNEQGELEAIDGIVLDISERKKFEYQIKYNSEHDEYGL